METCLLVVLFNSKDKKKRLIAVPKRKLVWTHFEKVPTEQVTITTDNFLILIIKQTLTSIFLNSASVAAFLLFSHAEIAEVFL